MKGKALSLPHNHVEWVNGFKSNMPDWPTARHCALVDEMLFVLKEARTVLLTLDRPGTLKDPYDVDKFNSVIEQVQTAINKADGIDAIVQSFPSLPKFPEFLK